MAQGKSVGLAAFTITDLHQLKSTFHATYPAYTSLSVTLALSRVFIPLMVFLAEFKLNTLKCQ